MFRCQRNLSEQFVTINIKRHQTDKEKISNEISLIIRKAFGV